MPSDLVIAPTSWSELLQNVKITRASSADSCSLLAPPTVCRNRLVLLHLSLQLVCFASASTLVAQDGALKPTQNSLPLLLEFENNGGASERKAHTVAPKDAGRVAIKAKPGYPKQPAAGSMRQTATYKDQVGIEAPSPVTDGFAAAWTCSENEGCSWKRSGSSILGSVNRRAEFSTTAVYKDFEVSFSVPISQTVLAAFFIRDAPEKWKRWLVGVGKGQLIDNGDVLSSYKLTRIEREKKRLIEQRAVATGRNQYKIRVQGSRITLSINDVAVPSGEVSALPRSGKIGFLLESPTYSMTDLRIDDFRLSEL